MPYLRPARTDTDTNRRKYLFTDVFWVPYSGISAGAVPTEIPILKILCDVESLDNIPFAPINEESVARLGKLPLVVNDGHEVTDFNITVSGNSLATVAALAGQDLTTNPIIKWGQNQSNKGALLITGHNGDSSLARTDVIFDLGIKIVEMPGATDGDNFQNITFYSETALAYAMEGAYTVGFEMFFEDAGSIVNAMAPDGLLDDFALGDGNESFTTPTVPVAQTIEAGAAGHKEFFFKVLLDEVQQSTAAVTFVQPTLTFVTPPPALSKIFIAYLVLLTDAPSFRPELDHGSDVNSSWYSWTRYLTP